jgi:serine protease Do
MTRPIAQRLWLALVLAWLAGPAASIAPAEPASKAPPSASPISPIRPVEIDGLEKLEFRHVINQAKERVFPAVVFVKCVSENYDTGKRITQESSGSGVLISPKGELLTNWHVVDKAVEVRCLLFDGQALRAKVVGTDKDTDLALLQLAMPENAKPLPYAKLGDSGKLAEGQFVMAMGAPWGLSRSVSLGILSCTRRFLPGSSEYSLWLQTDAAISPGNSGGLQPRHVL